MYYYKSNIIVTEYSTLTLVGEGLIQYAGIDGCGYYGSEQQIDMNVQHPECEVEELTFEEVQPILNECALMKSFNEIIDRKIAEKYTIGRELKMVKLDYDDPERIEYEGFIEAVKAPIREMKREKGLIRSFPGC
jgi:hypothetical protein